MSASKALVGRTSAPHRVVPSWPLRHIVAPAWRWLSTNLFVFIGIGILGVVWYAAALLTPHSILPLPHLVLARAIRWFWIAPELEAFGLRHSGLGPNLLYTIRTVVIAQAVGLAVGTILGLASARIELFRAALNPIVLITTTVPILVFAPFFLVWFGVSALGATMLVTLYATNLFIIYSQRGADNLDPVYENNALTLGASRARILFNVLVPGTIPEVLGGLRISFAGAWGLVAIAELLGSRTGIGVVIRALLGQFDTVGIMAAIVVISTAALLFDALIVFVARPFTNWRTA